MKSSIQMRLLAFFVVATSMLFFMIEARPLYAASAVSFRNGDEVTQWVNPRTGVTVSANAGTSKWPLNSYFAWAFEARPTEYRAYYIPYEIDSSAADQTAEIEAAIAHWALHTHVRLVKRTGYFADRPDYITFIHQADICASPVGKQGGEQFIYSDHCGRGALVHEIGHAIGLRHEQSRSDRDQFVTINFANIQDGKAHNFSLSPDYVKHIDYDYDSIMHYESYAFSRNGEPTIVKTDGSIIAPNQDKLSVIDMEFIQQLYPERPRVIKDTPLSDPPFPRPGRRGTFN